MAAGKFKVEFEFEGEPLTKSNSHFMKWNRKKKRAVVFVAKRISSYEVALKEYAKEVMGKRKPTEKKVRMSIVYYYGSKRRKDLQNLPKTTCDALNKIVYEDDNQVHELHLYRQLDRENPRVHIIVEEVDDSQWDAS